MGREKETWKINKVVRVFTICMRPYPYKNPPLYRKIVLNRTFVDALCVGLVVIVHRLVHNVFVS